MRADACAALRLAREAVLRVVQRVAAAELVQEPLVRQASQQFLLSAGALHVALSVGNGGVLFAGQALFVRVVLRNSSARRVEGVTLALVEQTSLRAHAVDDAAPRPFLHDFTRRRQVRSAARACGAADVRAGVGGRRGAE